MALGLTDELSTAAASRSSSSCSPSVPSIPAELSAVLHALTLRLDKVCNEEQDIAERVKSLEKQQHSPDFVLNKLTNSLHRGIEMHNPISTHVRTVCGWRYCAGPHQLLRIAPPDHPWKSICSKCLPDLRAEYCAVQVEPMHDSDSS